VVACDDAAAALYEGTAHVEIVATSRGSCGYRVTAAEEEQLPARLLTV
jgi:hypothetical protein